MLREGGHLASTCLMKEKLRLPLEHLPTTTKLPKNLMPRAPESTLHSLLCCGFLGHMVSLEKEPQALKDLCAEISQEIQLLPVLSNITCVTPWGSAPLVLDRAPA